ncbi:DUF2958 domain-containing protein [Polaribacter cellanae]|uniref:DUF2958 domain-containing protein n=1 Tax=Polaribacter cellanae TaxID=2818493 RepID=A0A975CM12_9FLAO|nr:DUF2958 domain-containing protein [Polaribacter cellanae]QTE21084.1 DUF2958 domain-containing protein [Polaribacter cellanae]
MKLITKELEKRFEQIGDQSEKDNPIIVAKYFNPVGAATWYATEYDPKTNICFGYVENLVSSPNGIYDEWGYFSLKELASVKLPFGLSIERDRHFNEITFKEQMEKKRPKRELETKKDKKDKDKSDELER